MGRQQKGSLMLLDKELDLHTFFAYTEVLLKLLPVNTAHVSETFLNHGVTILLVVFM